MDEKDRDSDEYRKAMKELGPPPLSEFQKIEGRWPFLFPLDHSKGELVDAVVRANREILNLRNRVKELEMESKPLRPVKCGICKKRMYYVGDPEHKPEVEIVVYHSKGNINHRGTWNPEYVHKKCWNELAGADPKGAERIISYLLQRVRVLEGAYLKMREATFQKHSAHWDRTGQHGAGCLECKRADLLREEADSLYNLLDKTRKEGT